MSVAPMVHLRTVHNVFHARVIAARLGAEGIVTELRGAVDGPYPIGDVSVWVAEADASSAQELLLADEVESAFDLPDEGEPWERGRRRRPLLLGLTGIQLLAGFALVAMLSAGAALLIRPLMGSGSGSGQRSGPSQTVTTPVSSTR
jgi:hypothetical protein